MDREIKKYRYLFAAIFTVLIFSTGILFSNLMDDYRSSALEQEVRQDVTDLESQQLQLNYLERQEDCQVLEAGLNEVLRGYNDRLDRVENYEDNSLFKSDRFEDIRHQYVLAGIRYWTFSQEIREKCDDYDPNTILYFKTETEPCPQCESAGDELTRLKNTYGSQVLIFVVHTDLDDSMVRILEQEYEIETEPTVVINEETKIEGEITRETIEEEMN